MAIVAEKAQQLVESVFTFDNVGDAMMAVRRDPSSQTARERLAKELADHASRLAGDDSSESLSTITKAVETRVQQFVQASKAASTGCGGTTSKRNI